jgi:hypothetical protein
VGQLFCTNCEGRLERGLLHLPTINCDLSMMIMAYGQNNGQTLAVQAERLYLLEVHSQVPFGLDRGVAAAGQRAPPGRNHMRVLPVPRWRSSRYPEPFPHH